jgi:hypothetical protein
MRSLGHYCSCTVIFSLAIFSCVSANGAAVTSSPDKPASIPTKAGGNGPKKASPPKIQEDFQNEFARQLVKAGPNSEGWALFSSSSMEDNGQRWIIRSHQPKNEVISFCFIKQGTTTCDSSTPAKTVMTRKEFSKIEGALKAGNSLEHILPKVFDGTTYEYLHAINSTPDTVRVVFITSNTPFPAAYETLIKAFNH